MSAKSILKLDLPNSGVGLAGTRRLLLLFGWFGAKPKHVSKYATVMRNACEDKDLTTLYTVAPWTETFGLRTNRGVGARTKWAEGVVSELTGHCGSMPLLEEIHVLAFSNGGAWPCMDVCVVLKEDARKEKKKNKRKSGEVHVGSAGFLVERLQGIVFDSSPAYPELSSVVRVMGFDSEGWLGKFERWFSSVQSYTRRSVDEMWDGIVNDNPFPDVPQLMLYSREDLITDSKKIEDLVETRKELGIDIKEHRFVGSPHVGHMRMFPDEYVGVLMEFMKSKNNN